MLQTLLQLKSGKLKDVKVLRLAENLTEFPIEILDLADTLELLDLSNNQLTDLPDDFAKLHQLKSLFLFNNQFEAVPKILADCPKLDMIGLKSNRIQNLPENALPVATRWLILTDNQLTKLPNSMGDLNRLQKCMLAGNQLQALPESMANCHNLQLLRISANQLKTLPEWLLGLPKLAWLAYAGNPFCAAAKPMDVVNTFDLADFDLKHMLGEGASGHIYQASTKNNETVAVKIFKGGITSDGYPQDELHASLMAGKHPNLVELLGHFKAEDKSGLVMRLIPEHYDNLGQPPSLESCTRDTFLPEQHFSLQQVKTIAVQIADTLNHLHQQGISHGDLYAHNILMAPDNHVLFGDFGATSRFEGLAEGKISAIKAIELRAFGALLDDLLSIADRDTQAEGLAFALREIQQACEQVIPNQPLCFEQVFQRLHAL